MLMKMRNNDKGFTLIELMIVIAIIGILAAIAIPNFVSYRQRSYNSSSQSDLKNAMTSQEAYFVDNDIYTSLTANLTGYVPSGGVTLSIVSNGTTGYRMESYHGSGNTTWFIVGPGSNIAAK